MKTVYMVILFSGSLGLVFGIMDQYVASWADTRGCTEDFGMSPPVSRISGSIDTLTIDYLWSNGCVG